VKKILPSESHVWNEKDRIKEHAEKVVETSDEATYNTLGSRIGQLCSVLEEQDPRNADEACAQNC
jgi:hypothetical protein